MKTQATTSLVFDSVFVTTFGILFILPSINEVFTPYPSADFLIPTFIGFLMIFSNKLKSFSHVAKWVNWVAIYIFKPSTKYNHLIWGIFLLMFPTIHIASLLMGDIQKTRIGISSKYLVAVTIVLLLNIVAGIYTVQKQIKNKT